MQFLVQASVKLPADMPVESRTSLLEREVARGRELVEEGTLQRIWRVPGAMRNVAIWTAPDATVLHQAIASLPLFPWMNADVTPLAAHPVED